jgi:ABC-type transport system involved in cytochrome bd biosynthesis fused ATPase/permease subunit
MVMQTAHLFPGTVSSNIAFRPRQRGEVVTAEQIELLLNRVGLPEFADRDAGYVPAAKPSGRTVASPGECSRRLAR